MSSLLQAALEGEGAGNSVGSGLECEDVAVVGDQERIPAVGDAGGWLGPAWQCQGTVETYTVMPVNSKELLSSALPALRNLSNIPSVFLQPLPMARWMAWRTGKEGSARHAP